MNAASTLLTVLQAAGGLGLLYLGGEALVRGSAALALQLGISRVVVGLTVVALGTSAPELVVSVDAALSGASDIALGNVVGSNIANVALILGLAAVFYVLTVPSRIARLDLPLAVLASAWLLVTLIDGTISRLEGALLLSGLAAYIAFTLWQARGADGPEMAAAPVARGRATGYHIGLVVVGLAVLMIGGHLLVQSAVVLARIVGVSEAAIGLTVVAVGTSLPELAASLVAAARRHGEIAVGNVVGSSIFNVLGIAGATATIRPLTVGDVTTWDLGLMTVLGLALLGFARSGRPLGRVEGAVLIGTWVGYTAWRLSG